ncbi:hypothetical protein GSU3513 [Geobacter sulfurreducens PCA]|uniref:Uncharacterized protein n=1 Tax=Geobacter sulfurreducens (strain ATCC 51573 / DSM 12127 / PCA) TaxID=243231 RepID=I7EEX0_GEOSL|nr:hypothetical protein GSU3513 [Geobacter sulfurreducens PCA]HBB69902.1 hypothetical protein [Geobacter sulfurreducens]HCD96765.1 hypothetical protein [Geobacter sulfurreducens]
MMQLAAMDGAMRCFRREGCTSRSVTGGEGPRMARVARTVSMRGKALYARG